MVAKFKLYQKVKLKDEGENRWYKYWYNTDYFKIIGICYNDHREGYTKCYEGVPETEPVYILQYGNRKQGLIAVDEYEILEFCTFKHIIPKENELNN